MSNSDFRTLANYFYCERKNERETFQKCRQQMRLYKLSFNICSKTIDFLSSQSSEKLPSLRQIATLFIMYRLIGSMQSIRTLTLKGYYYEANVLMRNFCESLGLCVYLKENPDQAEQWLHGKRIGISSIELFSQMKKIFPAKEFDPRNKYANRLYGNLCDYVHSNLDANLRSIIADSEEKEIIINGQSAGTVSLQAPSKFSKTQVDDLASLAIIMVFGFLHLFEDYLSIEKKLALAKFLKKQTPIFLQIISTN